METQVNKKNVRKALRSLDGARLCAGTVHDGKNACAVGHLAIVLGTPCGPTVAEQVVDSHTAMDEVTAALGVPNEFVQTIVTVNDDETFPKGTSRVSRLRAGLEALLSRAGAVRYLKFLRNRDIQSDARYALREIYGEDKI